MLRETPPFWLPGRHAARRSYLQARGRIAAAVRAWFAARDFLEVETTALQVSPGTESHLHAFATDLIGPGKERRPLYLRTSPEFACKKLLAAGETRIFEFARVFRNRERGALHHPEFTMLEWYRANEPYEMLMDDCAALLAEAAHAAGVPLDKDGARTRVYGMTQADWKARHQTPATDAQLAAMAASLERNAADLELDEALDEGFPASDPPSATQP